MKAIIIGATGATGKDIVHALNKIGLLCSIRPMPTSQVAHAMITMAKPAMEVTFTFEPMDIWAIH